MRRLRLEMKNRFPVSVEMAPYCTVPGEESGLHRVPGARGSVKEAFVLHDQIVRFLH